MNFTKISLFKPKYKDFIISKLYKNNNSNNSTSNFVLPFNNNNKIVNSKNNKNNVNLTSPFSSLNITTTITQTHINKYNNLSSFYSTSKPPPTTPSSPHSTIATQLIKKNKTERIKEILKKSIISNITPKEFLKVLKNFIKNYKKSIASLVALIGLLIYSYETPDSYLGSIMNVVIRFSRAVKTSIQITAKYKKLSLHEGEPEYKELAKVCHQECAELMLGLCLTNGGLYIKAGQYIASLNHILPTQYPKTLQVLQDQAPWKSFEDIEEVFLRDLGNPPNYYFSDFDKLPIAAASLAQVHKAITKEGDQVAVKVQYLDLQRNFEGDIFTHKMLLSFINWVFPDFEFNWMADEMKQILIKELDFSQEADNSERAAKDLSDNPYAYIPKVYHNVSSKRILVTEYINGCKINDLAKIRAMGLSEKQVATKFIEIMCEQIFIHGFVHVDPHAGNILVRQNPQSPQLPQIILLDHGLYREYDDKFRMDFCNLYKNLVLLNKKKVEKYCKALGVVENWKLFSTMILMRNFEGSSIGLSNSISAEELEKLLSGAMERMKELNSLMKTMPRHLLLILRNNNLLRSINMELGSPASRFIIFARYANRGLNSKKEKGTFGIVRFFKRVEEKVHLEVMLQGSQLYYYFVNKALSILISLGIINPKKLLKEQLSKTLG